MFFNFSIFLGLKNPALNFLNFSNNQIQLFLGTTLLTWRAPCPIPYVGGVPVGGTLILSRRHSEVGWPVPFLAAFNFPGVATRYPFAAGWTVSEHPYCNPKVRLELSMFCTVVKRSNHLATRPFPSYNSTCIAKITAFFLLYPDPPC